MRNRCFIVLASLLLALACGQEPDTAAVRLYISRAWDSTLRFNPGDTADSLIGLPRPYTVPCAEGMFNELYYWDTFFTNEGLIADGLVRTAEDNVENILFLIDRYGFMPNGNRLWYLSRSQPPYAALMVEKVYEATADTAWLRRAFPILEKEYAFWMRERMSTTGLNRYGWNEVPDTLAELGHFAFYCCGLKTIRLPESLKWIGKNALNCSFLKEVWFEGSAPANEGLSPDGTWSTLPYMATAYYPAGDESWTEEVRKSFGNGVTWVPYVPVVRGDANGDGAANILDIVRLRKCLAGVQVEVELSTADLNGDGVISPLDLMQLRKLLVGTAK